MIKKVSLVCGTLPKNPKKHPFGAKTTVNFSLKYRLSSNNVLKFVWSLRNYKRTLKKVILWKTVGKFDKPPLKLKKSPFETKKILFSLLPYE